MIERKKQRQRGSTLTDRVSFSLFLPRIDCFGFHTLALLALSVSMKIVYFDTKEIMAPF
jgi:hypothetical protein